MRKASEGLFFRLALIVSSVLVGSFFVLVISCITIIKIFDMHYSDTIDVAGIRFATMLAFLTVIVLCLIIAFIVSLFLIKKYLEPIEDLKNAMNNVAKGEMQILENEYDKNEVGELIKIFNKMVEELKYSNEKNKEYASYLSHEIKTPLAAIKGYCDLLEMDELTLEEKEEYISIIKSANERLINITSNILLLNKVDRNLVTTEVFSLDNQIRETVIMLEKKWEEKNITVNVDLEEFKIESNKELTGSIWNNIILNAIKFTNDGGEINIVLKTFKDSATVIIEDDGIGISEEDLPKIFDRSFQVNPSEGSGLGLAIVKEIISKINGGIHVESKLNQGTKFTIKLNKKSY